MLLQALWVHLNIYIYIPEILRLKPVIKLLRTRVFIVGIRAGYLPPTSRTILQYMASQVSLLFILFYLSRYYIVIKFKSHLVVAAKGNMKAM